MRNKRYVMKNKFLSVLIGMTVLGAAGCKPESPTMFAQQPTLYFGAPNIYNTTYSSGTQFSFGTYPHRTVDTFLVPVSVLGAPSPKDREFSVLTLDSAGSNAVEGKDYQLLPPYVLPANATTVNVPVVLFRSSALDSTALNFYLRIAANGNFAAPNTSQGIYGIQVSYLQKPSTWDLYLNGVKGWAVNSPNFGTWTKTKYKLILDALYNPVADTSVAAFPANYLQPPPIYAQYLQIVKNYILTNYPGNYSGAGPTLRDPDANNALVQVGPANY